MLIKPLHTVYLKRGETGQKTALTFRTIDLTKHKSLGAASCHSTNNGMSRDATDIECQFTHTHTQTPQLNFTCMSRIALSLLLNSSVLI